MLDSCKNRIYFKNDISKYLFVIINDTLLFINIVYIHKYVNNNYFIFFTYTEQNIQYKFEYKQYLKIINMLTVWFHNQLLIITNTRECLYV